MSDIRANTISDTSGNGPINLTGQSAAKAWVNFNGGAATAAPDLTGVRGSFNVSGLVDNAVGNYTINFTNNLASGNFAWSGGASELSIVGVYVPSGYHTTHKQFNVKGTDSTLNKDTSDINFIIHGDLA